MLRVRGESMIEAGIFDRDFILVRQQSYAENGDIVCSTIRRTCYGKNVLQKKRKNTPST